MEETTETTQLKIEQQKRRGCRNQDTQTSESLKSTRVRQVASTESVEKVEMNAARLTAGIEKRADGGEFM